MLSRCHKKISQARDTVVHTYRVSSVAYVGQQGEGYTELEHCGSKLLLLPHQGRRVPCDILHLQFSGHERVSRQEGVRHMFGNTVCPTLWGKYFSSHAFFASI